MLDKLVDSRISIRTVDQNVAYRFMVHQPGKIAPMLPVVLQQYKKSIIVFNGKAELYWQKTLRDFNRNVFSFNGHASGDSLVTQTFLKANEGILLSTLPRLETAPRLLADAIFVLHLNFGNSQSKEHQIRLRNIYLRSSAAEVAVYFFIPDAALDLSSEVFINGFMNYLRPKFYEDENIVMVAEPLAIHSSQNKTTRSSVRRVQMKSKTRSALSAKPVFDRVSGLWKSSKTLASQPVLNAQPVVRQTADRTRKPKAKLNPAKPRPKFQSTVPIVVTLGDTPAPISNRSQSSSRTIAVMQLRPS